MDTQTATKVRGDWMPEGESYEAAKVDEIRWNGWAVPRFTEAVARQITEDTNRLHAEDPEGYDFIAIHNDPVAFDIISNGADAEGDVDEADHELIEADEDGLFCLGGWAWCWEEVEEPATEF